MSRLRNWWPAFCIVDIIRDAYVFMFNTLLIQGDIVFGINFFVCFLYSLVMCEMQWVGQYAMGLECKLRSNNINAFCTNVYQQLHTALHPLWSLMRVTTMLSVCKTSKARAVQSLHEDIVCLVICGRTVNCQSLGSSLTWSCTK